MVDSKDNSKFSKGNLIGCISVFLLFAWFVYSILPLPAFQYTDGFWMWLPRLGFSAREMIQGSIPFWNEFQFCGIALLADASTNILNPSMILYFFLSPEWAYTISMCAIFLLLIIGTWKYFRILNFSSAASLIATIGYCFSGQVIFWSLYHGLNFSFALFPWILFSFRKLKQKRNRRWQILAFILVFFDFFGGYVQLAFFTLIAVFAEGANNFSFAELKKTFKSRFVTTALAALSASVIIIPTIETCMFSHRSFVSYYPGLFPDTFILFFMSFFGDSGNIHNYPNYYFYVGIILLGLAIFGIRKNFKKMISYPYLVYSLIFPLILVALYVKLLPQKFQFGIESDPWRGIFCFIFALSLSAAKGTDYYLKRVEEENKLVLPPLELLTCALVCFYSALILNIFSNPLLKNVTIIMGVILAIAFILPFVFKKISTNTSAKKKIISCLFIILIILNSFPAAKMYLGTNVIHNYNGLRINKWKEKGLPVETLSCEGRVINLSPDTIFDGLFEDWAPFYRIRTIGGYAAHIPRSMFIRMKNDGFFPKEFNVGSHLRNNSILDTEILAKYGVLYLVDENKTEKLVEKNWKLLGSYSDISLYRNPEYIGRAYIVDGAGKIIKNANIIIDSNSYIKILIKANANDTLILADSWFPGWKCYDNGKTAQGFNADGLRGYTIKTSGPHIIEWVYSPESFRWGAIISIISFGLFFLQVFRKVKDRVK